MIWTIEIDDQSIHQSINREGSYKVALRCRHTARYWVTWYSVISTTFDYTPHLRQWAHRWTFLNSTWRNLMEKYYNSPNWVSPTHAHTHNVDEKRPMCYPLWHGACFSSEQFFYFFLRYIPWNVEAVHLTKGPINAKRNTCWTKRCRVKQRPAIETTHCNCNQLSYHCMPKRSWLIDGCAVDLKEASHERYRKREGERYR